MKKLMTAFLFFVALFLLTACVPTEDSQHVTPVDYLDFYYLNDLHGAILEDGNQLGFARIGHLLMTQKTNNPENTIILAGGDMLQGSALSNYYYGKSMIELMNATFFDALVIGNHEFDWGLETVTRYFDGRTDESIASFPLLGANIHFKGTDDIPDGIDPYTILTRGDLKIGIIGTIGYGLETSIATQFVEDYAFKNPLSIVAYYAEYLRTEEDCDIIILLTHDSGQINMGASQLTGDQKIDAIFNGHSHQAYTQTLNGIPVLQSGGYGEMVGHIRLNIDDKTITSFTSNNLTPNNEPLLLTPELSITQLIELYVLETDELFNTPILYNEYYQSRSQLTAWMSKLMRIATNADVGIQNYGGTRHPIGSQQAITLGILYDVFPFDNTIKTVWLSGAEIKSFLVGWSDYDTDITNFVDDQLYKVATNSFIFDQSRYPFLTGENPTDTGVFQRDLAVYELTLQSNQHSQFSIYNPIYSSIQTYFEDLQPQPSP